MANIDDVKTPAFLSARRTTNQTIPGGHTWNNVCIIMNSSEGTGIAYDENTGIFALEGAKTYRITAQLGWESRARCLYTIPNVFIFRLVNLKTGEHIGPCAEAQGPSSPYIDAKASSGFLDVIYTPLVTGHYCLKTDTTASIDPTYSIRADVSTYLNITELTNGGKLAYLSARRSTPQIIETGTWATRVVNILESEVKAYGMTFSSDGYFVLQGGVTYRITAQLGWEATSLEWYAFGLFDSAGKQIGPAAEALARDLGTWNVSGGVLDVIHTPEQDGKYALRVAPGVKAGPTSRIRADVGTFLNIISLTGTRTQGYAVMRLSEDQHIPEGRTWASENVKLNQLTTNSDIIVTPDGMFSLLGGITYRITAQLGWKTKQFSDEYSVKFYAFGLFHEETCAYIGPQAEVLEREMRTGNTPCGVLDVIFTPQNTGWYYLKIAKSVDAGWNKVMRAGDTFMNIVIL